VAAAAGPWAMGVVSDIFGDPKYGFILATGFAGLLFVGMMINWIYNPAKKRLAELDSSEY
jgi:MFS-type transporter involved in bile tolerance (Atg22 family)